MILLVKNVPRCIGSNAKTLGMKHLLFHEKCANGGSPCGEHVVHLRTDHLLVQQNSIADGETASVYEGSQHSQSATFLLTLSILVNQVSRVWRVIPKITGGIDPLAPRRGALVGVSECPYRLYRTASRNSSTHWYLPSILSVTIIGQWDMSPDIWRASLAEET